MVPYLKTGDWNQAMLQTVVAVCGVIEGDESLSNPGLGKDQESGEGSYLFWLALCTVIIAMCVSWHTNRKRNTCPKCGAYPLKRYNSQVEVDRVNGIEHHKEYLRCPKCGYTVCHSHDEPFDNGTGFGGFPPVAGPFHRGFGGGFGGGFTGGSFGGGSFGGGGSGGRF